MTTFKRAILREQSISTLNNYENTAGQTGGLYE